MTDIQFSNLKEFNLDLNRFTDEVVPELHITLQKKIALDLLTKIVLRTPVGNPDLWKSAPPAGYVGGRARGNWQVELNSLNDNESDDVDSMGQSTIGQGSAEILHAMPFGVIWIFNNVPYINALEDGHSTQAPAGMVELSVLEAESFLT